MTGSNVIGKRGLIWDDRVEVYARDEQTLVEATVLGDCLSCTEHSSTTFDIEIATAFGK
ncbi:hypothetical protein ACLUWI_08200 [Limosilactobacillus mucosae]|uniref:hypothetical protein n=1 Tax=Limosilactobacillus mucosae TaxID=97478 RepID=UPI003996BA7D